MVKPAVRRQVVGYLQQTYNLSERSACRALGVSRASHRYESTRPSPDPLVAKLRSLAGERPRFGYRRLGILLRRKGERVNHKRVYRLYRLEGLALRIKRRKKRAASVRITPPAPRRPGERWSMDFVFERTELGASFRVLTVIDDFSRRCPGLLVERGIGGAHVARFLDELAAKNGGYPHSIVMDNGPEFISNALDQWAHRNEVKLIFSRPGKPTDNAFIESFNGHFRDECLNANWFSNLDHAREVIEEWVRDYNDQRPHSSLDNRTPNEYERTQLRTHAVG